MASDTDGAARQATALTTLTVRGCRDIRIGSIIRGNYVDVGENHSRPMYRKKGMRVFLYFWDERDGPQYLGWWFGPEVGGEEVCAYSKGRSRLPPSSGWHPGYNLPVDQTILVTVVECSCGGNHLEEECPQAAEIEFWTTVKAEAQAMRKKATIGQGSSSGDHLAVRRLTAGPFTAAKADVRARLAVVDQDGHHPAARFRQQVVPLPERAELWMIGGQGSDGRQLPEVWAWSAAEDWRQVASYGFPRFDHFVAAVIHGTDGHGAMIVCIGMQTGLGLQDACWALDPATHCWRALPLAPGSSKPCGRLDPAVAPILQDPLVALIGGHDQESGRSFDDLWVLDLQHVGAARWRLHPHAEGFNPRHGHSATALRHGAVTCIFGGECRPAACTNEVWLIDWTNPAASLQKPVLGGEAPAARSHHAACALGKDLLAILSGCGGQGMKTDVSSYLNDIHVLDIGNMSWLAVVVEASAPWCGRMCGSACAIPHRPDRVLVFGGVRGGGKRREIYNDLAELSLVHSPQGLPAPSVREEPAAQSSSSSGSEEIAVVTLRRAHQDVCRQRRAAQTPEGFQELRDFLEAAERAATSQLAASTAQGLSAGRAAQAEVEAMRRRLATAQAAVGRARSDASLQRARDEAAAQLHARLTAAADEALHAAGYDPECVELGGASALRPKVESQKRMLEEQADLLRGILAHAGGTAAAAAPEPPAGLTVETAGSRAEELRLAAMEEAQAWQRRAAGESEKGATEAAVGSAWRKLTDVGASQAADEEGLEEAARAFAAARAAIQAEQAFWADTQLHTAPFGPLVAAGSAELALIECLLEHLQLLLATDDALREEARDVSVILNPQATKEPAISKMQAAAAACLEHRYAVEDAERALQRARERGLELQGLTEQLQRARVAARAAHHEASDATAGLLRLMPAFPELQVEFRDGLPRELLGLWVPERTLKDFDHCELLPVPSRNHVYKVSDHSGVFAVKRFLVSPASLRTCWKEAAVLHRARHPHIVELVAAFEDAEREAFFLQFPYYDHGSIDTWCSKEQPGLIPRLRALHEVAQALAHLHGLGITHADVKPANILIGADGRARLADFDVSIDSAARTCSETVRATTRVGFTPAFMAPEVLTCGASPESDMFAFGATADIILPVKDGGGPRDRFVEALQDRRPARRPTAAAAMQHEVFQPLFRWQREETRRCCVMASDLCGHGGKEVKLEDGVCCGGRVPHFVCNECLSQHVLAAVQGDLGTRRLREGRIFCPSYPRECECPAYSDVSLARAVHAEVFERYTAGRIALLEEQKARELEAEMQARVAAEVRRLQALDERQRAVRAAARHIREEILTLKCPGCAQAFVDFEGCFALRCNRCRTHFCGWCLTACGGNQAAHDHVRACAEKPPGADVFYGTPRQFEEAMERRKSGALRRYMATLDDDTRQQVTRDMQQELQGLLP